jgi:plastocyanin domain-containing protein
MELNFGKIIVSFISITIIEAVSLLFILKSNKSQKEIEQFVENLGEDN